MRGRKRKIRDRPVEKEARIMSGSARKKMPPVMILERGASVQIGGGGGKRRLLPPRKLTGVQRCPISPERHP